MEKTMSKITTFYKGNMLFESKFGSHSVQIDVPELMGGKNRGPKPSDLFMAALGSCIGAAVVDHCQRFHFDMSDMSVNVKMDEVKHPTRWAYLQVTIHIPHSDCRGQEDAILRLTENCPIYKSITKLNGIQIELMDKKHVEVLKWFG